MGARDIRYLSVQDVTILQRMTVERQGGMVGLRDPGLLDAAVQMPRQQFGGQDLHEGLGAKAAAYLFHIASNHPFADGNKRAAVLAALVFLERNLDRAPEALPDPVELEAITMAVASSEMSKPDLIAWFREKLGGAAGG